jgi:hypothetical protein
VVALLLVCYPLLLLAQKPAAGQLPNHDQNSILNLYDAFGYQKRGTILDWGFGCWADFRQRLWHACAALRGLWPFAL